EWRPEGGERCQRGPAEASCAWFGSFRKVDTDGVATRVRPEGSFHRPVRQAKTGRSPLSIQKLAGFLLQSLPGGVWRQKFELVRNPTWIARLSWATSATV